MTAETQATDKQTTTTGAHAVEAEQAADTNDKPESPREFGGPAGPEPTRYGDWERRGRCIDF